jgi:hypothetical protein
MDSDAVLRAMRSLLLDWRKFGMSDDVFYLRAARILHISQEDFAGHIKPQDRPGAREEFMRAVING